MCDCFHLAFPNWHAASSGTGAGRRLRGPEPGTADDSICEEPPEFTEGERPRPQGSSPIEEYPETEKYTDSDKECEAEHDPHLKSGSGKKTKKSGLGSMFEKRSTPKMSKLKEVHSPESGVIVKTAKDGCAEGLVYGGGGKEGIYIKEVVPESPASKSLKLKEGDQILSATVYFDNISYEDALQILEHAQAYKLKLCLKRKPDISETEPAVESDVIPEEELCVPEMREQGRTKRRGDARISWPKFPSFGKGQKSRFTRSHSSSEADEQRKLELSPTTSDTESPIKSQDALKGKKRHKTKLTVLTKRGRISSSEDQDTDAPTTGQMSGDIYQTSSDMLSPKCIESLSGETPEICVTEDQKGEKDLRHKEKYQRMTDPQSVQHKVELISIDSTLKTADLTVALADQEIHSGVKSPIEKKKKKERSELKMKLLGKDKSHKKDAKAKASPKRLKTLGASLERADQPVTEMSEVIPGFHIHAEPQGDQKPLDVNTQITVSSKTKSTYMDINVPKVELDISDVTFKRKSHLKEQATKDTGIKQKQETKTGPTFKLPTVGLSDIATEETIQKLNMNVEEHPTKSDQFKSEHTAVNEDPYNRLSKSRTQLPKREDIEIPGMEDKSMRTTAKGIKESKLTLKGRHEEITTEMVQLSIDVDSVKEAVSKLPGFKLPKVDISGMPIPEEITVIDANAQRISVKTPTKVADSKTKRDAHLTKTDINASPEILKTVVKLPNIIPADLTTEKRLTETRVDTKTPDKILATKAKQSDKDMKTEISKREDIQIPGKESDMKSKKTKISIPGFGIAKTDIRVPDIGIDLPKQNSLEKGSKILGERTIVLQDVMSQETRKEKVVVEGVISDVKIPEIDSIDYIDSVVGSPARLGGGIKGVGIHLSKKEVDITRPAGKAEVKLPKAREVDAKLGTLTVTMPKQTLIAENPKLEIKSLQTTEVAQSTFKIPKVTGPEIDLSMSKKDVHVPEAKVEINLPKAPEVDTKKNIDASIPEQKIELEKPELEIKPLQTDVELDGRGSKFKMPKFGIKIPKISAPEIDITFPKKDVDVTLPEATAEIKLPKVPEVDANIGSIDVSIPEQKIELEKPELELKPLQTEVELDGHGSKFKMPKFGIKIPKIKAPEFDLSLPKKDVDVTLPEAAAEINLSKAPEVDANLGSTDVSIPEQKIELEKPELEIKPPQTEVELDGHGSKFKMPRFGIKMPKIKGPEFDLSLPKKDVDVTLPEATAEINLPKAPEVDANLGSIDVSIPEKNIELEKPELEIKPPQTEIEVDGHGSKFKMPKLGIKMPKIKGPEFDLSLPKKDVDVTLPEATAEINLPKAPEVDASLGSINVSIPEQKIELEKPELEIKPPQTDVGLDGHGSKFKMPRFGIKIPKIKGPEFDLSLPKKDVDVTLPEATAEIKLPKAPEVDANLGSIDVSIPEKKIELEKPEVEIKPPQTEVELDGHGSKFKMPRFGIKMPKIKGPEFDLSLPKKDVDVTLPEATAEIKLPKAPEVDANLGSIDVSIPEKKMELEKPELEIKPPQTEIEVDGHGSKFKMPKLGIKMPKIKGPEFDLSLPKKDVDVTLPEATAEIKLPKAPEVDANLGSIDVSIPEQKIELEKPELEIKLLQTDVELDGHGSKFKMPKFGIKMPKIKGPEFDLSLPKKDVDVTLPQATAEIKIPKAPEVDANLGSIDVSIPEQKIELEKPELEIKPPQTEIEVDGHGSKFKMPKFGIKIPKIKGPEFDFSLPKKDMDITLPEATAEIKLPKAPEVDANLGSIDISIPEQKIELEKPELEIKPPQTENEVDGHGSKFKMPKFGIKMPKIKGPEFDLSLPKKDVDVTLPEATAEINLPKAPEVDANLGSIDVSIPEKKIELEKPELEIKPPQTEIEVDGHGSKFKMPKLGIKMPKIKGPEFDLSLPKKDVDVTLPEATAEIKLPKAPEVDANLGSIDVSIPEQKIELEKPELEIKLLQTDVELDGHGSKFKMPKFGIKMPKIKGPEFDLSLPKKDVDITLPEATAEIKLPKAPEVDANLGSIDISIPEQKIELEKPELEIKPPQTEVELDGHGSKFKMPRFGIKMPKLKGPEFDLSLPKKDVDVTLPEATAEIKLPKAPELDANLGSIDISIPEKMIELEKPELEIKPPQTEIEVDGHGSKFKMPKFGIKMPKIKGPEFDLSLPKKDVDVTLPEATAEINLPKAPEVDANLGSIDVSIPEQKTELEKPELEIKPPRTEVELDGHGSKFKMPRFGIKMPKLKGPEFDLSLPKKDVDVTLPEATAEIKLPKAPEVDANLGSIDVSIPEQKIELEKPELEIKPPQTEVELDGHGSKFKMPRFGIKMPKLKGPEFDLSLPKKDVDITLLEATAEIKLPKAPEVDANLGSIDISIPEQKIELEKPELEIKPPQTEVELDGHGSKFKMPRFGIKMPKLKGPEFDLSLPKKDVDVTLPEATAEIKLPKAPELDANLGSIDISIPEKMIELEKPELEIKPPQTGIEVDGHGSKFKMPKFGIKMPKIKGPEFDLSLPKKDVDVTLPEATAEINLPKAPEVDANLGSIDVSIPEQKIELEKPELEIKPPRTEVELDGHGSKFKMPRFGIKMPKLKGPEFDLSLPKKDVDVTLPEATAEIKLPKAPEVDANLGSIDVSIPEQKIELEKPELEIKPPQTEIEVDGHGSKFKMPMFGINMPKIKGPEFDLSLPKKDVDVTLPEATAEINLPKAPEVDANFGSVDVSIPEQKIELEKPELEIKPLQTEVELDGHGSKFKMPRFGIKMPKLKGPEFDLSLPKKDVDVTLPEATAEIKLPKAPEVDANLGSIDDSIPEQKIELKKPEVEIKPPQTEVELDGHRSKFKMPRFGIKMPKIKGPEFDLSLPKKDVDVTLPEATAEIKLPKALEVDANLGSIDVSIPEQKIELEKPELEVKPPQTDVELDGHGSKFKMPRFGIKMPKIKGPEFDLSLPKKDVNVTLPEATAEIKLPKAPEVDANLGSIDVSIPEKKIELEKPEVEIKSPQTEVELDGHGRKFKMPRFGIKMPKIKGPEFDLSLPKKDVDVTLPEATAEIKLPQAPEVDANLGSIDVYFPEQEMELEKPDLEIKSPQTEVELHGHGSKFKMPSFGIKMPKIKGPEFDLSLPKKDVDVTLPEATAEIKLPQASEVDANLGSIDVYFPEQEMKLEKPDLEINSPQTEVELDGHGSKFKMPSFGIKMPKIKGPEFDLSLPKKDVDVTLPEATAEIKLPKAPEVDANLGSIDVSIPEQKTELEKPELEIKPPQTDVELDGHGRKFKMPRFGIKMPKIKGPEFDLSLPKKDVDVTLPEAIAEIKLPKAPEVDASLGSIDVSIPEQKTELEKPELEIKPLQTDVELDGHGRKFQMPRFGIKMPKIKGPEFDLSLPKKDVDVTLPEATAEIKLPKAPEVDVNLESIDVSIPEQKPELEKPELEIKPLQTDVELDGHGRKFKMPRFGIKMPKVKGPEFDLSLPKKDVDVTLPEATAEIKHPEAPEVDANLGSIDVGIPEHKVKVDFNAPEAVIHQKDVEGSPSKFKLPTFKLPKFGSPQKISVEEPNKEKQIKVDGSELKIPKDKTAANTAEEHVSTEDPSLVVKMSSEVEGKGSKFKLPKFGLALPKLEGPKIDLSVSTKDVDVKLPEAKLEVQNSEKYEIGVNLGKAEASIQDSRIEVQTTALEIKPSQSEGELDGPRSDLKMPKFGMTVPRVKECDMEFSLSKQDVDAKLPDPTAEVSLPDVELKEPYAEVEVKAPELEVQSGSMKGSPLKFKLPTFKFPKFGVSAQNVGSEGPTTDLSLSKNDVDIKIPVPTAEVEPPDIELKKPSTEVEIKPAEIKVVTKDKEGSPSKFKMPTFKLPKFGVGISSYTTEVPNKDKDIQITGTNIQIPEEVLAVNIEAPSIDTETPSIQLKTTATEDEGKGNKFKLPTISFSVPHAEGPHADSRLSKKDVDVTIPEAKIEIPLAELEKSAVNMGNDTPGVESHKSNVKESPSKFKMRAFKLPKFGAATPKVSVQVPDVEKDIKIDVAKIEVPEDTAIVNVTAPCFDAQGLSFDVNTKESEPKESEPQEPQGTISVPDAPTVETEAKLKRSTWTFPKLSFSRTDVKAPAVDVNLETPKDDVTLPETTAEACLPQVEVKELSGIISVEESLHAELDANLKKSKFSLPRFSFSKSSSAPKVSEELAHVEVFLPEGEVIVKQPQMKMKGPELDVQHDGKGSKLKLPKLGIALPKAEGPQVDLNTSQKDVDIKLPDVKAEVKLSDAEVKESSASGDNEANSKYIGGSPLKVTVTTLKMPDLGDATYDVSVEAPDSETAEIGKAKLEDNVKIIDPNVDIKTDMPKAVTLGSETPKTDSGSHGSPSRFKLPSFKMPKISFSRSKAEDGHVQSENEKKEDQLKTQDETISPKLTLTSFGDVLKNIDVEFDVQISDKPEENQESLKGVNETSEPGGQQLEANEKDTNATQETTKSPEKTAWFKFPRFGLSSPSEPVKISESVAHGDEKTPAGETGDEEISPTCSVQSSDAFADVSSTMTSEHVALSISSPTKVTVKYSDPNGARGVEEIQTNTISSTTRTELISVEPNLPEKITILSSGVSSSSEDTLKLESGKIHVITSNVQATPEPQHATLLSAVKVQSAGGLPLKSEPNEAASWTVEDSKRGRKTVFERHFVSETSSERSEMKETIVITKQITQIIDSSELISGEAASSIQRLRDSVHSEKMKFFDGTKK